MEKHYALTDSEFEQQFETAMLHPDIFTHEAHLRLAWVHLQLYGLEKALGNITSQLRNYTRAVGAADKYNETVTIAAIHAVHHFRIRSHHDEFENFIRENSQLKTNFKDLINTHYKTDIFKSTEAKKSFLEPELLPFD
jgi:hypothetical protein